MREPFDATWVVTQQIRGWQMTAARLLRIVERSATSRRSGWPDRLRDQRVGRRPPTLRLAATDRERRAQALSLFAAVAAEALRFAWPWATRVMMLVGGDDPLTYETYARDILFNGILMSGGQPLGQGEPFYYQAFYPYFLARHALVFGEFMFGALLVQRLLAARGDRQARRDRDRYTTERAWIVALPIATAFIGWKFWHIAGQPLNESLYVPLLVVSAAGMIRLCDDPKTRARPGPASSAVSRPSRDRPPSSHGRSCGRPSGPQKAQKGTEHRHDDARPYSLS